MNILFNLFLIFARVGLFTFGGGLAMISVIEDICVQKKKWITHDEMMNLVVIAESTPGPIAINCATYVGFKIKGFWGAVAATIGIILPSLVIIYVISIFLNNFLEFTVIANAFKGIKIAVGILITDVAIKMILKADKHIISYVIMIAAFVAMMLINVFAINFSTITMMLIAGVIGLVFFAISNKKGKAGDLL